MFLKLAKITSRYKIAITLFWIALAVVMIVFAPALSEVGVTDDSQFLPVNTESRQADNLLKEKFPAYQDEAAGSALILIYNSDGLSEASMQEAGELNDWLLSGESPDNISGVISVFQNDLLSSTLVSSDQTVMLFNIDLSTSSASPQSKETVDSIRQYIKEKEFSSSVYVTGGAGVFADALKSIQNTIDKATLVTVLLVVFLLLIIYRSPVAILVPLITIGISYLVSRGVAGYIAVSGADVSSLVDAYLVVTLFGIGTDYCLFMVSRFKEEILQNNQKTAVELSLKRIGPVILASATTVIVALLCLGISNFGMNRTSGYILAVGVAITLLAGLTLTPALISFFGRNLLWPARLRQNKAGNAGLWQSTGQLIVRRPVMLTVIIVIILGLPYLALPNVRYSADTLSQMPQEMGSVQGFEIFREHFSTGTLYPVNIVLEHPGVDLTSPDALEGIKKMAESLKEVEGVSRVSCVSTPAEELDALGKQTRAIGQNLSLAGAAQLSFFQNMVQDFTSLGIQYPGITQSANFQDVVSNMTGISELVKKVQTSMPQNVIAVMEQVKPMIENIAVGLEGLAAEFDLLVETPFTEWLKSYYFSEDMTLTRLEVILDSDPYAPESVASVTKIREELKKIQADSAPAGIKSYTGGTSADLVDIMAVNNSDFLHVLLLAVVGIIVVTAILLRSIIAPLYMILTVLLNFGATMGISAWILLDILGQNAMIYMLPVFVFVMLVAVGSDYNIFLVSRIREEAQRKPVKEAICAAVTNTGGVITSCGVILAGTFLTLTTASMQMVFQVGAAIGIGVLIDTFLVRAVLIPSIATLFGRMNWWPSRLFKQTDSRVRIHNGPAD
ncbi:MAG: MMPL family transporter [Dehalococcoidales bacterium]|nr:MMPL family transporter [Dehalococcoidales bacterium]